MVAKSQPLKCTHCQGQAFACELVTVPFDQAEFNDHYIRLRCIACGFELQFQIQLMEYFENAA